MFAFIVYDLHYSWSDIMELPLVLYLDLLDIYERERVKSEQARMHAELKRMIKR